MRRVAAVLVLAALVGGVAGSRPDVPVGSRLAFAHGTPLDVRALAERTWERFVDAFPARRGCIRPVTVRGAWVLADRGSYDPAAARIDVRIPGTAPNLEATLVHEFAHHLEATCPEHRELRSMFLRTLGLPGDTPWFGAASWSETPSEQLAETMTVAVLERRSSHLAVLVEPAAVERIRAWGRGG